MNEILIAGKKSFFWGGVKRQDHLNFYLKLFDALKYLHTMVVYEAYVLALTFSTKIQHRHRATGCIQVLMGSHPSFLYYTAPP